MRIRCSLTLVLLGIFVTSAAGQTGVEPRRGGPPSTEQLLRQHHVELTQDSLIRALRDPDSQVRYLAAEKLAEDGAQDTIPSIAAALKIEKVPATRVNMAFALALLRDENGFASLRAECADSGVPGYLRARAATYLLDLHREDCFYSILNMLESDTDPDSLTQALSLIPSFHVAHQDSERVLRPVADALADKTPAVRLQASVALGLLGNAAAIPALENALAEEQDDAVRLQMKSDLQKLRKESPP
jgi:HEAT repeat protein